MIKRIYSEHNRSVGLRILQEREKNSDEYLKNVVEIDNEPFYADEFDEAVAKFEEIIGQDREGLN